MVGPNEPVPQRIGDAERDEAASCLREHLAQGRLDVEEFDERLSRALAARTRSELDPLFVDLPAPKPGQPLPPAAEVGLPSHQVAAVPAAKPPAKTATRALAIASAFAWPAALIFCFATHWAFWWVMLIPMFIPWWAHRGESGKPDSPQEPRNH